MNVRSSGLRKMGLDRIWRTTQGTIAAIFGERATVPYGRGPDTSSDFGRRGIERHLLACSRPTGRAAAGQAAGQSVRAIRDLIGPTPGESWREKAARVPRRSKPSCPGRAGA